MAKDLINIPEGFVLDKPANAGLPEGFVLDEPIEQPAEKKRLDLIPDWAEQIIGKTPVIPAAMQIAGLPTAGSVEAIRQQAPERFGKASEELGAIPIAHYVNQRLLNLPRAVTYAAGYEYPEATTAGGQIVSKLAGIAGGTKAISPILEKITKFKTIPKTFAQYRQVALKGAGYGALYTPTEDIMGLPQRAMQAAAGAVLSPAIALTQTGIAGGVRGFRKMYKAGRTPAERQGALSSIAKEKYQTTTEKIKTEGFEKAEKIKQQARLDIDQKESEIYFTNKKIGENIIDEQVVMQGKLQYKKDYYDNVLKKTKDIMDKRRTLLAEELQSSAEKSSEELQPIVHDWFKRNSKIFGERVDEASQQLELLGKNIIIDDQSRIIADTLGELESDGLAGGFFYNKLKQMQEGILERGKINPDYNLSTIPFKDFLYWSRSLNRDLPEAVRIGSKQFADEQIAAAILMDKVGEFIETKTPEFSEVRKGYAPVIRAMRKARKWFRPTEGSFETKPGTEFLKRLAMGRTEVGEERALKLMQEGAPKFAKGVGTEKFKSVQQVAEKIKAQEALRRKGLGGIQALKQRELTGVGVTAKKTIAELQKQKIDNFHKKQILDIIKEKSVSTQKAISEGTDTEMGKAKKMLEERLNEIAKGKFGIQRLQKLQQAVKVKKWLTMGEIVGPSFMIYLIHRAMWNASMGKIGGR